jgi:hypothetical protein
MKKYPRLYLELLENKEKVEKDKLFQEFEYSPVEKVVHEEKAIAKSPALESIINIISPTKPEIQESLLEDIFSEKVQEKQQIPESITLIKPHNEDVEIKKKYKDLVDQYSKPAEKKNIYQKENHIKQPTQERKILQNPELILKKQKLLVKLDILKKSGKNIPNYTLDHDYYMVKKHYKLLVKQIHVDNKVSFYKKCLLGLCGCVELGLGKAGMGFDMEGYTEFHANNMNKYEKLLIKIGEKSYIPSGMDNLPVELQLCITMILQTILFAASKLFKNKMGFNMFSGGDKN